MHSYNWKELSIIEEMIEQFDKLAGGEGRPITGYGYPFFEWYPGIEIHETMENDEEENIMVGK